MLSMYDALFMVIQPRECFRKLSFEKYTECTSRHVERTSRARVMIFFVGHVFSLEMVGVPPI